ncbi:MAG: response regulator [Planctomycetota bacterium]
MDVSNPRILIVEDSLVVAKFLEHYLTKGGFELRIVETSQQALDLLPEFRPNALITDVVLCGGKSGLDLCREIRGGGETALSIIVMTSHSFDEAIEATADSAMEAGADAFLTKPISPVDLFRTLERLGVSSPKTSSRPSPRGLV